MTSITELQALTTTLIDEHADFADITVLADDGLKDEAAEQQLRPATDGDSGGPGVVVMVSPVLGFSKSDKGGAVLVGKAAIMVSVLVNPAANTTETTAIEFVKSAIEAVMAYTENNPNSRYDMPTDAISLTAFDAGLEAYNIMLEKLCVL